MEFMDDFYGLVNGKHDTMEVSMDGGRFVPGVWLRACNYFLWFVAGSFFGYIWMANAYGLLG